MIRFFLVFGVLSALGSWDFLIENLREPYCEILAHSIEAFFSVTSLVVTRRGSTLSLGMGGGISIVPSCDGLILLILFLAGVAAMPIQRKLWPYAWAGACLLFLVFINWIRLVVLMLTNSYWPDVFEAIHLYVAQGALIFATVVVYSAWLSRLDLGGDVEAEPAT